MNSIAAFTCWGYWKGGLMKFINLFRYDHIFKGRCVSVAAQDSKRVAKRAADLRCDGIDDDREINKAFSILSTKHGYCGFPVELERRRRWKWPWQYRSGERITELDAGRVILYEGTYNISESIKLKEVLS